MKTFEFNNTSIPSQFTINLRDNCNGNWVESRTGDFFRVIFASIADVLSFTKNKNDTIGFKFKDSKGNFIFGAILDYITSEDNNEEAEETSNTGNFFLRFTFDENDMSDIDAEYDNHSDIFVKCAENEAGVILYGRFNSVENIHKMYETAFETLKHFLDTNATEDDEVEVTLKGIFTASVHVEESIKKFSIVPGESIKQIIKEDSNS